MRPGARRGTGESDATRLLPLLLVPVALLPNLSAALPLATYYFRDLSLAFFPMRLFSARELAAGRLSLWNPYFFEGSFQLPSFYPPDLLHALWPSPVFISWLLTLHLPLAAVAAYWLARELGAPRAGAFLAGAVFALSGFTLSCLNLYIFLQALALAPFVAGLLRRAASDGGRAVPAAAAVVAAAISTLAVEFVLQAIVLGVALGVAAAPDRLALRRLAGALALAVGLAGFPVVVVASLLPETARGAGFSREVVLAHAVHPAVLAQTLLPHLFGLPQAPTEAFWGGRFFSNGLPYFLSLYLGPLTLALAAVGAAELPTRVRLTLLPLATLGLWYAFGEAGGLAPLLARLPILGSLRYPSKALLLPQLVLSLCAGLAVARLRVGRAWIQLSVVAGAAAVAAVGVAVVVAVGPSGLIEWSGVQASFWPHVVGVARREAGIVLLVVLAAGATALAVSRGILRPGYGVALVIALAIADLSRAGSDLNRQVHPSFFEPLPEIAALRLNELDGARVFSYGHYESPAFRAFVGRGGSTLTLANLFLHRQLLGPYASVLDGVEVAEATDLTAFAPRDNELSSQLYDPARIGELLPWLRNAGVARVLSLDPLSHPSLVPLTSVPAGPSGLSIHVYGFEPWPRASLACRATPVATRLEALNKPYQRGFDPWRELALERSGGEGPDDALPATCTKGRARRTAWTPSEERYDVETNASAYLVVRASHARGWHAQVDGVPAPVLRANGKHRAVAVSAGRHEVVLRYAPPGLAAGMALSALSLAVALVMALGAREGRR